MEHYDLIHNTNNRHTMIKTAILLLVVGEWTASISLATLFSPMALKAVIRSPQVALGEFLSQTLRISALSLDSPCI